MEEKIYDLIIIGCGPAGITAGIYARRAGLDVLVIEKGVFGGQTSGSYEVKNYPGFKDISGSDLSQKMFEHLIDNGAKVIYEEAMKITSENGIKNVYTYQNCYTAKSVILALGAKPRKLDLDNEKEYLGKGLSYCAVCDGNFFKGKIVAVVGGGNSAFEDANYLSNLASKVYLIHRREEFKAQDALIKNLEEKVHLGKVEYILNSQVVGLFGQDKLNEIEIENLVDKSKKKIKVDGLFVAVGRLADTSFLPKEIALDDFGYIIVDDKLQTSIEGIFSAGDCNKKQLRQIVTACADGAISATNAFIYLKSQKK